MEGGPLLVMQYVRGGNIARPWRIRDLDNWSDMEVCNILYQCLLALAYLHAKPTIVHRDIKPENILMQSRYPWPWVRLADFGLAKEGSKIGGQAGTMMYTAPEVFSGMFISY